jgi:hypothetical protein
VPAGRTATKAPATGIGTTTSTMVTLSVLPKTAAGMRRARKVRSTTASAPSQALRSVCGSALRSRLLALTGAAPRVRRGTHGSDADSEHSACDDGEFAK